MWRWLKSNQQSITALAAMLVSVTALYVAWDQSRVMRAQQHGAVVPVLQIDGFTNSTPETRGIGLRIHNNGVGPAMVETVEMVRNGESTMELDPLLVLLPDNLDRSWSSVTGRAIAPGGLVEPVTISWDRGELDDAGFADLMAEWALWDLRVCYCSVFDRCWLATASDSRRQPVAQCSGPTEDVFERLGVAGETEADE
jgi:hypothetical protein